MYDIYNLCMYTKNTTLRCFFVEKNPVCLKTNMDD